MYIGIPSGDRYGSRKDKQDGTKLSRNALDSYSFIADFRNAIMHPTREFLIEGYSYDIEYIEKLYDRIMRMEKFSKMLDNAVKTTSKASNTEGSKPCNPPETQ